MLRDRRIVSLIAGVPAVHSKLARELADPVDGFGISPHDHVRSRRNDADRVDVSTGGPFRGNYVTRQVTFSFVCPLIHDGC